MSLTILLSPCSILRKLSLFAWCFLLLRLPAISHVGVRFSKPSFFIMYSRYFKVWMVKNIELHQSSKCGDPICRENQHSNSHWYNIDLWRQCGKLLLQPRGVVLTGIYIILALKIIFKYGFFSYNFRKKNTKLKNSFLCFFWKLCYVMLVPVIGPSGPGCRREKQRYVGEVWLKYRQTHA